VYDTNIRFYNQVVSGIFDDVVIISDQTSETSETSETID
jgi:hypothetical protein